MNIIKAYHTCEDYAHKNMVRTKVIAPLGTNDELRKMHNGRYDKLDASHYFTYFKPIQPLLHNGWGDCGFTFDSQVLIHDFNGCLCHDTWYVLRAESKQDVAKFYLEYAKDYKMYYGISWPKPGPLYGHDAMNMLMAIQEAMKRKLSGSYASALVKSELEANILGGLEIRCPVEIPLDQAYSTYTDVPRSTWWQIEETGCIHQSMWPIVGYETMYE